MKRISILLLLLPVFVFSQKVIDVKKDNANPIRDGLFYVVGGIPFSPAKYVEVVSGTPFYNEDYITADVTMTGGGVHKNVPVKIDLLSGDLIYKDSAGNELVATSAIGHVVMHNRSTGKDVTFVNSTSLKSNDHNLATGWYQLIEAGSASLYKKMQKTIKESKPYNSATTEQTIQTTNKYFVEVYGIVSEIKKAKELSGLLSDKSKEMENYISSNKINVKDEGDWKNAVVYYNSLHTK